MCYVRKTVYTWHDCPKAKPCTSVSTKVFTDVCNDFQKTDTFCKFMMSPTEEVVRKSGPCGICKMQVTKPARA